MTDKCACCGQPATHKISSEEPVFEEIDGMKMHGHPYTNYVCDDCFRLIMHNRDQYFAAGPWQPMDTAPKNGEAVLLLIEYDGNTITAIGHNHGLTGWCVPGNNDIAINGVCKKWARINMPEDK